MLVEPPEPLGRNRTHSQLSSSLYPQSGVLPVGDHAPARLDVLQTPGRVYPVCFGNHIVQLSVSRDFHIEIGGGSHKDESQKGTADPEALAAAQLRDRRGRGNFESIHGSHFQRKIKA